MKCTHDTGRQTVTNRIGGGDREKVGCFRINTLVDKLINNRKIFYENLLRMKTVPQKKSNNVLQDEHEIQDANNQSGNATRRGKEERARKWRKRGKVWNTARQANRGPWLLADLHQRKAKGSGRHNVAHPSFNALDLSEHPKSNCLSNCCTIHTSGRGKTEHGFS
jgi:hypothetical protein